MNTKWIKLVAIILAICIIVLTIILINVKKYVNENIVEIDEAIFAEEAEKTGYDEETAPIEDAKVEKVANKNEYFTVKYILDKYFTYVDYIYASSDNIEVIKNVLSEDYYKNINISGEQIQNNIVKQKNEYYTINSMYCEKKTQRKTIYFVNLILDGNKESQIIIKTDAITDAFSVLPQDYIDLNEYSEKSLHSINVEDIEANKYNKYNYATASNLLLAQEYISDYGKVILTDIEKSYNLLDSKYVEKRFPTFDIYKNYIQNCNKNFKAVTVENLVASKDSQGNNIFSFNDQYGNSYVIKETGLMEYTIQLDSYTLENEVFNKKYAEAKDVDKCVMNLQKFLEMINMQDYESAYSVLDETFRQNNFGTVDNFANYMRNNFFRYNVLAGKEYLNDIADLHTYRLVVKDGTGENQNKLQFNAVMRLLDGNNFVMSFGE